MITGRCECGKVRYEVEGEITELSHCHCSICRRLHGAAFATWGEVSRNKFKYLSGENHLKTYSYSYRSESIFCENCGSRLLVDFKAAADMLYIAMGTVDGDVKCPPGIHQFAGSKAPWFDICDDLPQHDGWPNEEYSLVERLKEPPNGPA